MKRAVGFVIWGLALSILAGCAPQAAQERISGTEVESAYGALLNTDEGGESVGSLGAPSTLVDAEDDSPKGDYKERAVPLDEQLLNRADSESLAPDKLKILFKALEDDSYESRTMENSGNILSHTMNLLYAFLSTPQSADIGDKELEAQFSGVTVMPLKEGRLVLFSGKPSIFGESSDSRYVFYQRRRDDEVSVFKLYEHDYLRLENAFVKTVDDSSSLIYTTGATGMNMGSRNFINVFKVTEDTCVAVDPLGKFQYKGGPLMTSGGLLPAGFTVAGFTEKEIVLAPGDSGEKLKLAP